MVSKWKSHAYTFVSLILSVGFGMGCGGTKESPTQDGAVQASGEKAVIEAQLFVHLTT